MAKVAECLYCRNQGQRAKEDIVPKAIGGSRTIDNVCQACNNGPLSSVDKELVSKSPLSIVAAQELGKTVEYTWDVDHSDGNVLLEGAPNASFDSMIVWPQLVLTERGFQLRADAEDFFEFGSQRAQKVFIEHLVETLHQYRMRTCSPKQSKIWFERIEANTSGYAFPPRIFVRHPLSEIGPPITFQCRYKSERDRKALLKALFDLRPDTRFPRGEVLLGSYWPSVALFYEATDVLRALVKIGLNLLANLCRQTNVNSARFPHAVGFVTGQLGMKETFMNCAGFVKVSDIEFLQCPTRSHKFRLSFNDASSKWHLYCSFFGGRIGAKVYFPGPNRETWHTADVTVPIGSDQWIVEYPTILFQPRVEIVWGDLSEVVPSISIFNARAEIRRVPASI